MSVASSDRPNSVSAECSAEYSAEYSAEAEYSVTVAELTIRLTIFGRKKTGFSQFFTFFPVFFLLFSDWKVQYFFRYRVLGSLFILTKLKRHLLLANYLSLFQTFLSFILACHFNSQAKQ